MPTQQEKIDAAQAALAALGATDPAEAERFVALFDSQAALLLKPEQPTEPQGLSAAAVIRYSRPAADPALEARIAAHEAEALELAKIMIEQTDTKPGTGAS